MLNLVHFYIYISSYSNAFIICFLCSIIGSRPEYIFIQGIIKRVSSVILNRTPLFVAKYPTGVDSRVEAIESLLDTKSDGVRMVGIYGLGGIGKTTIAKAVHNKIADRFEGCSFLMNVRENSRLPNGIIQLQEKLLFEILGEKDLKKYTDDTAVIAVDYSGGGVDLVFE